MGATSCVIKKLHCGLKWVTKKKTVTIAFRTGSRGASHISVIAKLVRGLEFVGFGIAAVVDIIMCAVAIFVKYQRLQRGEVSANEFIKYAVQKSVELVTNLIFAIVSGLSLLIPVPFVGPLVSIAIGFIGYFTSKLAGWCVAKACNYFLPEQN